MKNRNVWTALILLCSTLILPAEEPSFAGTWKMNMKKSQLSGQTFKIEKMASGLIHWEGSGMSYDVDLKGNEYPRPEGGTTAWLERTSTNWEITNRRNGKATATFSLLLNGDSMTTLLKVPKADGSVFESTTTAKRVSGGPGFFGKWKESEDKSSPRSLEIAIHGQNGITIKYPEFNQECTANIDTKDYPLKRAGSISKITVAFETVGSNTMKMTTKLGGKPYYVEVLTMSPDGQTLTDDGNSVSADEPIKAVYERQ